MNRIQATAIAATIGDHAKMVATGGDEWAVTVQNHPEHLHNPGNFIVIDKDEVAAFTSEAAFNRGDEAICNITYYKHRELTPVEEVDSFIQQLDEVIFECKAESPQVAKMSEFFTTHKGAIVRKLCEERGIPYTDIPASPPIAEKDLRGLPSQEVLKKKKISILPIGTVNLLTGANKRHGTIWDCWAEDPTSHNMLVKLDSGKFIITHTCGEGEAINQLARYYHDQTGRSIGTGYVVATAPHTKEGLRTLSLVAEKKKVPVATYK